MDSKKEKLKSSRKIQQTNKLSNVINALFVMANCKHGRIHANNMIQIFLSLKYTANYEVLVQVFKDLSDSRTIEAISFSQIEILTICMDQRVDKILSVMVFEYEKKNYKTNDYIFDHVFSIIRN